MGKRAFRVALVGLAVYWVFFRRFGAPEVAVDRGTYYDRSGSA